MRVAILFVRHGSEKYPLAESRLREIYDRQLKAVETFTVVIDNALPPDYVEAPDASSVIIGGDNSAWEFSAWDKGLRYLGERVWAFDLVHFVTSAFDSLYTAYLDLCNEDMLRAISGRSASLGHIDCYNEPVELFSYRFQHWIRSSFLFVPPTEIKMLPRLARLSDVGKVFDATIEAPFGPEAEMSANYQRYIVDWLTGADIGQGTTWHSKFALTQESLSFFRAKATAILNEHLLSIRLRVQATRLVDVTWLSGQLENSSAMAIDWSTPWQRQLAERKRDRVLANVSL